MRWIVRAIAAAFVLAAGLGNAQPASKRIALVIGNGAYQVPAWRLANPPRDAALIAAKLRGLGFDVDAVNDATRVSMDVAFERFGAKLKASGPDAVGLFYYAGHGAQGGGVNFLVPVDANAATADRLRYQSPSMQFLLDDMAEAGNAVNIIILDACRDMPLPDGSRSIGRGGLADVGRLPNVFIAYATAPGRTAADGGGANSPFTTTLAAALDAQAGEPIELLFSDVGARVYTATGGGQAPEFRAGLVRAPRWSFAAARPSVVAVDPELERLRRENETLRKAGAGTSTRPPTPSSASVVWPPAPNGGGAPVVRTGETFRDCPDCPEMVVLPAGSFLMGSPASEANRSSDEGPQRTVSIRSFAAGKTEITFAQWDACVAGGGCGGYRPADEGWGRGSRPVINVSWNDAQSYVAWINGRVGGQRYRLLTEAEWEYAARAGTTTTFSTGASISTSQANFNNGRTHEVGSYAPNAFGLYDMHGNVLEWVQDRYANTYDGAPTNGAANSLGSDTIKVSRGGTWQNAAQGLRSADRNGFMPDLRGGSIGFRVRSVLSP